MNKNPRRQGTVRSVWAKLKSSLRSVEIRFHREEIKQQALEVEQKMSIRAKISVSLFVVIILILPVVGMTLHYFSQLRKQVDMIARTDAKLIDLANRMDESMLLAKRAETNFILLRDSLYVKRNIAATQGILELCAEGKAISVAEEATFHDIAEQAGRYQDSFLALVASYKGKKGIEEQIRALRQDFTARFGETLTRYNEIMARAKKEPVEARRDSLINTANEYLRAFSIDDLTVGLQAKRDPEMTVLSQVLSETSETVRSLANQLEQRSWGQVERHRQESEKVVARAQRNISIVLILSILVSAYMVFVLPARIVKPITAMTSIIKRAEKGDYEVKAESASRDEVGQLALFLNRMLKQVRTYDGLKTEKILTQQKKVEALADAITDGVLILNHEQEITLINHALKQRLDWQSEWIDQPLSNVDSKGELAALVREALENDTDVESRTVGLQGSEGAPVVFDVDVHLLRDSHSEVFGILVMAGLAND